MSSLQHELQVGWQMHQQRRFAEAEHIYRKVLKQAPADANAWCFLGIVLHDQRQFQAAVDCYRQALQLHPDFPVALNNLGNSLRYINCIEEADACFQQAIDLKPDYLNAFKNRGTLHVWTGDLEKGLAYYEQALRLNPQEAELHRNLGVIYLLQGRFEEGWREYRWRWQVGDLQRPNINVPIWDGTAPSGKRILLSAEQGLGDTLNFVRFAKLLRDQGADTLVYCQPALLALLQQSPELGPVYPNSLGLDRAIDCQCSLVDVADLMQLTAETIPQQTPYVRAAPHLRQYWAQRLPPSQDRFRVGIAWQGNKDHQADVFRSIPLHFFERLVTVPGVELISLQAGYGTEQLQQWRGPIPITLLGDSLDRTSGAFMDTVAIMQHLDLVITSDTSIAHLAGAAAVPTWIALNYVPDWRWLLQRSDSPWYPSVRLFRQQRLGEWSTVFNQLHDELNRVSQAKLQQG